MEKSMSIDKQTYGMKAVFELSAIIGSAMEDAGYGKEESRSITETAIKAMAFMAGGRQFYLPRGNRIKLAIRNSEIIQKFTGANVRELATEYDLSEVQIYSIIRDQRNAAK